MYEIDKNRPIPNRNTSRAKYPYNDMDVGDSFFVPLATLPKRGAASFGLSKEQIKSGMKIARRTVEENGTKGVRVWRIS